VTNPNQVLTANFLKGLEYLNSLDNKSIKDARLINQSFLINSGRYEISIEGDTIVGLMYREEHGIYQNFGVKRANFNIGLKKWTEVSKRWAEIVKPGLSSEDIAKFQAAVYFKKKSLPASAYALKPRPWIKTASDVLQQNFNEIMGVGEWLNALINASFEVLEAA